MSADTEERLVYMANQIARNFAAQGEEAAVAATANHIRLFWDPRMKKAISACDPAFFDEIAGKAVSLVASDFADDSTI